jgi:hypothetical protein
MRFAAYYSETLEVFLTRIDGTGGHLYELYELGTESLDILKKKGKAISVRGRGGP